MEPELVQMLMQLLTQPPEQPSGGLPTGGVPSHSPPMAAQGPTEEEEVLNMFMQLMQQQAPQQGMQQGMQGFQGGMFGGMGGRPPGS